MNCYYINLLSETEKRAQLEKNFAQHNTLNWSLQRFEAIDRAYVRENQISGNLSEAEKGCFLSHLQVLKQNLSGDRHIFIMEDDIVFSSKTAALINRITSADQLDWDIIYTDICVPDIGFMLHLHTLKMDCRKNDKLQIIDLKNHNFASAAAYIVNKKSVEKIAKLLDLLPELNIPIDIAYRNLVHSAQLKGFVAFPFLTSLSSLSENSQVQPKRHAYTEVVWHSFRKMIWIDGSAKSIKKNLEILEKGNLDEEAKALALIFSGFLANDFVSK
jgi:GR25 family glycosyltransferase involved in LPS biosynthesis